VVEDQCRWFEEDFDKETAIEFLLECQNFTSEYVLNHARELVTTWPLTNVMPKNVFQFKPEGAVVHISETPSMWNALHMQTRNLFSSHFLVMSGQRAMHLQNYPLLSQLPSTIFMLYPLDAMIPHAGYMSPRTWGIELRNAGRLRPVLTGNKPLPLMPSEETERNFMATDNVKYDCYWRQDLWRHKFNGPVANFEDYYYELPTVSQVISLTALLRALDCVAEENNGYGLDRRLVIPSNCISAQHLKLPFINWNIIREQIILRDVINPKWEWLAPLSHDPCQFEGHDLDWEDESLLAEQFDDTRWRGERDDGQGVLLNESRAFKLASGYTRSLSMFGYDSTDPDFSLKMWAIARGMGTNAEELIYNRINHESPLYRT
jgi:hypothetical protein